MAEKKAEAPLAEQQICVTCGFCCDGTLFAYARLSPGEKGQLPEKIDLNSFTRDNKDYFRHPCPYFSERCTIYNMKKPDVCSTYRCQLLKDFAAEKLSLPEVMNIINEARRMRSTIMEQYRNISGKEEEISFWHLLTDLGNIQRSLSDDESLSIGYEILTAGSNIFEALLIKHIRSASDFENMMTGKG